MTKHTLKITHGTSRARDTYGYNTVTLTDETSRKFRVMGGGYDMFGSVLAEWIEAAYPDRVAQLHSRAYYRQGPAGDFQSHDDGLYGVYAYKGGRVRLEGAVGESTIQRLAREHLNLSIRNVTNGKGHTTGYVVEDTDS